MNEEVESGFVEEGEAAGFSRQFSDVEVLRVTRVNVIARGRRYGRQWLIKGLRSDLTDSTAYRHRLMKEFEVHSRLHHSSVAHAVGFEEVEGLGTCLIMEWIEGTTLSDAIREGHLSKQERRRIMRDIIDAVAYVHSQGVIHRDLKPSNIMLRKVGGEPVLIDFGLADTDDYVELKEPSGTPGFVSPEQQERGGAHTADDVYSLGVIMNELCPEYSGISRRCMSPLRKRPADARAVRVALDRRDRRPKVIMWSLLAAIVVVTGVIAGVKMSALSRNAIEGETRLSAIAEENSRNLAHVAVLNDSLERMSQRLASEEEERRKIESYTAAKDNGYRDGCKKVDAVLQRYDREVLSKLTPANTQQPGEQNDVYQYFNDMQIKLQKELQQTVERHCERLPDYGLSSQDSEKIRMDLCNYYTVTFSDIYNKWLKRIYPEMNLP